LVAAVKPFLDAHGHTVDGLGVAAVSGIMTGLIGTPITGVIVFLLTLDSINAFEDAVFEAAAHPGSAGYIATFGGVPIPFDNGYTYRVPCVPNATYI
jgi:hypothetical protein